MKRPHGTWPDLGLRWRLPACLGVSVILLASSAVSGPPASALPGMASEVGPDRSVSVATTQISPNWSGYGLSPGPFTEVNGTFTVPGFWPGAKCDSELSEWVGIDGMSTPTAPGAPSILQAGITELGTSPQTGVCAPGRPSVSAWWENVPMPPSPVATMKVRPGNRVAVTVRLLSAAVWQVTIVDDTNGQRFTTKQHYTGPASSAEWILEAPTSSFRCGAGLDPWAVVGLCPLSPYHPAVSFADIGAVGQGTTLWPIKMVQSAEAIAVPSTIFAGDFGVIYTGPES